MKSLLNFTLTLATSLLIALASASYADERQQIQALTVEQSLQSLLKQHRGKVIYLDFWASWCGPCRKSFPWMNRVQQEFNSEDFTVISINVDAQRQLADNFIADNPVNFPVVFDPEGTLASRYQLIGMPSSYLIGRDGEVKITHVGFFSDRQHQYEQEISNLLQHKRAKND